MKVDQKGSPREATPKAGEAGISQILVLLILVAGLAAALYLSRNTTKIFPKASEPVSGPIASPTPKPTPTPADAPPTVTITTPINGVYVNGSQVGIRANASDDIGVTKVEFYVDEVLLATSLKSPYGALWNIKALKDGSVHYIKAIAYDTGSHQTKSSIITVTIDRTMPTVSLTAPQTGSTVITGGIVTVSASASDNVGVERVVLKANATQICSDNTVPYSCSWRVPTLSGVTYTISATAIDKAGNSASDTITVTSR